MKGCSEMSAIQMEFVELDHHWEVTLSGTPLLEDWKEAGVSLSRTIVDNEIKRILIDITPIKEPMDAMARFSVGVSMGRIVGGKCRLAALSPRESIDHFWEDVVNNLGAAARVGHDRNELIDWLLEKS